MTRPDFYFAYGSNMLISRIQARAPAATVASYGYVSGYRITFDKPGKDGSGKCHIDPTGNVSDRIYGVLFKVTPACYAALDLAEDLGIGYEIKILTVTDASGKSVEAAAYSALERRSDVQPYRWYRDIVLAGAIEHNLPQEYQDWLRAIKAVEDPDAERQLSHEKLLPAKSDS